MAEEYYNHPDTGQPIPINNKGYGDGRYSRKEWIRDSAGFLFGVNTALFRMFEDGKNFGDPAEAFVFQDKFDTDTTGVPVFNTATDTMRSITSVDGSVGIDSDGDTIDLSTATGVVSTPNVTSQASESWNSEDEPLDTWQAAAKVLIDGNTNAIEGLATASMEYIYNGDLPLTTVEQQINFVTSVASSNTDIMDIDDANNQAELYVDARYTYYTYISVTNDTPQDHIMHLITRTEGGVLLTDREFTVDKEGYLLLRLEDTVVDITGTPLIFELYARADDSNALKITYLKSHISAGGEALVSSYLKKDGSNAADIVTLKALTLAGTLDTDGENIDLGGGDIVDAGSGDFTDGLTVNSTNFAVDDITVKAGVPFRLALLTTDPSPANGYMYYNTTTNKARICTAGAWKDILTT